MGDEREPSFEIADERRAGEVELVRDGFLALKAERDAAEAQRDRLAAALRGFAPAFVEPRMMAPGPCKLIKVAMTDAEAEAWEQACLTALSVLDRETPGGA